MIRDATRSDLEGIRRVGLETWPPTYAFAGQEYIEHGLDTWWSAEAVERGLANTVTKVAEVDGEVIGMGNLDLRMDPPVIWKLYVLPSAQGTGAGSALMDALRDALPDDRNTVTLEYVDGNERAAKFYAHKDFVVTGRTPSDTAGHPDQIWATWNRA